MLKMLGEGRLGSVQLALHKKSRSIYAIKKMNKKAIIENNIL